ncbi:hypothetical protein GCM10022238_19660 [Gordonia hankookensis]
MPHALSTTTATLQVAAAQAIFGARFAQIFIVSIFTLVTLDFDAASFHSGIRAVTIGSRSSDDVTGPTDDGVTGAESAHNVAWTFE